MKYFTYIKYKNRRLVLLGICILISIRLSAENSDSTLVDIPFGKQRKEYVTSSFSTVSGQDLQKSHSSTLSNTLFGRIPGLAALQTSGESGGDEANLYLRGLHSFSSNSYIVLLDGQQIDGFNQISPDEIESITYLKDAASLALYGISGANGVLMITTRRGINSRNKVNIGFNARYGLQAPLYIPKFEKSYNYARLYNEALVNDDLPLLYTDNDIEGYKRGSDPYYYPDVNWYDEILKKTSDIQDYSLTFNGGNDFARYFVMAGIMNNKGLYANTDQKNNSNINFRRINFRANLDLNITKSFSAQIGLGGRLEDRMSPPMATGDLWQAMATYAPNLYPVLTPGGQVTGTSNFPNNPLGTVLHKGWDSQNSRDVQSSLKLNQKLDVVLEGLSVFGQIYFNSSYKNSYGKTRSYAYYEPIRTGSTVDYIRRGNDTDLTVTTGNDAESNRMDFHAGFEYSGNFGEHEWNALVMYQQSKYKLFGQQSPFAKQAIVGRASYANKGKYLAEFSFSYSGTDNYPSGNRFGFFPALSAGWILSKEDFLANNSLINFLKLRGSAGLVGSDMGAPRFGYNQYWDLGSRYTFGTGTTQYDALLQLAIANPNLSWEKALIYNIGLESRWFDNRLDIGIDAFFENRYDILVNYTNVTPGIAGVSFETRKNAGKVHNYGFEISARFSDRIGDVSYFVGGNLDLARNKIIESFEAPKSEPYRYQQNNPIGQRFGLESLGFFRDDTDITNHAHQTFGVVSPGDLKYKNQNNDQIIDINDEVPIGKPNNPELNFAFNLGASYKGFDLSLLFQGNANRSVYLDGYMFWPYVDNANISSWAAENRWTPGTHATATFPRLTTNRNSNNYRASDFWVRNVSLLRLRNAELGYSFRANWLEKIKIEKFRVYVSALNLFTMSNLDLDVDPETLSYGYPTLKTYSIGLTLNF